MNPDSYNSHGIALHQLQRYQEAIASFDQAIRLDPAYANAYGNRGNSLIELRQYQQALESYDQVVRLAPGCAEAYNGRATALHGLRQLIATRDVRHQASDPSTSQLVFLGDWSRERLHGV